MGNFCGPEDTQRDQAMSNDAKQSRLLDYNMDAKQSDDPIKNAHTYQIVPSPFKKGLRAYIQINISSFRHNLSVIKKVAQKTSCEIIFVVKGMHISTN